MKCVSRSDWKGTFPTVKLELELTEAMQKEMTGMKQYEKLVVEGEVMPTLGSTATNHRLSDMIGLSYDDPKWEALLDQITYEELCNLIGVGYHGTIHLPSVSKPETHDENGPQGFSANLTDITGSSYATSAHARGTYDGLLGVLAGTDTFDSSSTTTQAYQLLVYNAADPAVNDVHLVLAMREAAHRILYTVANSNAMNENGVIVSTMNWWQFSLIDGIIFSSLAALVFLALTARDVMKSKKKKQNS